MCNRLIILLGTAAVLSGCAVRNQTFVVVGHDILQGRDTINIVRRIATECNKSVVYPVGTIVCRGKMRLTRH